MVYVLLCPNRTDVQKYKKKQKNKGKTEKHPVKDVCPLIINVLRETFACLRTETPPRSLHGRVEQVEALPADRADAVVVHADRGREVGILPEQPAAVEAVEQVVGQLQHPAGQTVLQVEQIEAHDALDRASVLLVVVHDLPVAEDPERLDLGERTEQQPAQLLGRVFAHVPRVARQRHRGVGRRHEKPPSGPEDTVYFGDECSIVADVFDDLERDHPVERGVAKGQGRHHGLEERDVPACEQLLLRTVLVDGNEPPGVRCDEFDAVPRSGADFEHLAADAFGRGTVGQPRTLEDEVVRGLDRDPFRGVNLRHGLRWFRFRPPSALPRRCAAACPASA